MQMSVAYLWNDFSETLFSWTSSKNAYRLNVNRTRTEQHSTHTERKRNGYGTDTERIQNGYRTNAERERERVWNGNRTRSLKRSLLGFFWSVLIVAYMYLKSICDNMYKAWNELIFCQHKMENWFLNKVAGLVFLWRKFVEKICDILQTPLPLATSNKVFLSPVLYK